MATRMCTLICILSYLNRSDDFISSLTESTWRKIIQLINFAPHRNNDLCKSAVFIRWICQLAVWYFNGNFDIHRVFEARFLLGSNFVVKSRLLHQYFYGRRFCHSTFWQMAYKCGLSIYFDTMMKRYDYLSAKKWYHIQ